MKSGPLDLLHEIDTEVDLHRRDFLKVGGLAGAGLVFGGAVVTTGCGKNISFYVSTVIGALKDLLPLLPNLSDRIRQAIGIAETFDKAYREGKFVDAATIFENLATVVSEIIAAIGVMSDGVKLAVVVGGVALRAIGVLLKSQASDPQVAAEVARSSNDKVKALIEKMGDLEVINQVMKLVMVQ